jgi:hypothetical protein
MSQTPPCLRLPETGSLRQNEAARNIILFQIISARPSKQPFMVCTFLKVYGARLLSLFLQEQIKDIMWCGVAAASGSLETKRSG